ncbi:MAG: Bacterial domain [Candidatus Parcubacteria bacterium]|jgi:uncharacterized membrane protein YdbT with pleckstrin-like domain|nr:Bacterial domain [Candidatus Parcubacteria bacterium]
MIALQSEQHLGNRGFVVMILGRLLAALALFVVAFLIAMAHDAIVIGALRLFNLDPVEQQAAIESVSEYISFAIDSLFAVSVLLIFGVSVFTILEYYCFTFTLQEFSLRLRRGIIYRREVTIPYRQMQDINVQRTLLYRLLGTSRLVIDSAGHEEPGEENETEVILSPIDWQKAADIREFLQRRIAVQIVKTEAMADKDAAVSKPTN